MRSVHAFHLWLLLGSVSAFSQQSFYRFSVDHDRLSGAPDFSSLNHPLGPADRLFVRDAHFYRVGPDLTPNTRDDEPVRLFGVNLSSAMIEGIFPEEADAPRVARRLRRVGVNLVRMIGLDTNPERDLRRAKSILTTGPFPTLNPVSVARLRRLLDALKAEGIYLDLDLYASYRFRPDVDRVPPLPERYVGQYLPDRIFYPRMVELQAEYIRKVMDALQLKNDPVLAMVDIDNETSLIADFQRSTFDTLVTGEYKAELERQWEVWAHGRPKTSDNYLAFLTDTDRTYFDEMARVIRSATDDYVPVTGTQMYFGGLLNLDSQTNLDYLDNHFYVDLNESAPMGERIKDSSAAGTGMSKFLNMAAGREAGRPYTISEYGQPWPNRQGAEINPSLAAFGAFQDWDALIYFGYPRGPTGDSPALTSYSLTDEKYVNTGQAAWLFRTAGVRPGKSPVHIAVPSELRVRMARERYIGAIAWFLQDAAGYDPAMALVHPVALTRGAGSRARSVGPPYLSDTGELLYDPARRIYAIQAPSIAGAFGFLGKAKVAAGAVEIQLVGSARGFATILVSALDGKPIEKSGRMLLTTPGYTLASVRGSDPPQMQKMVPYNGDDAWWTLQREPGSNEDPGSFHGGVAPVWMERVEGFLTLRSSAPSLTVYPLDGAGKRLAALPESAVTRSGGAFRIHLQADGQALTPWYELTAP